MTGVRLQSGGPAVEIGKMLQDEGASGRVAQRSADLMQISSPVLFCNSIQLTLVSPGAKINSGVVSRTANTAVLDPWAGDGYWPRGHLLSGHTERIIYFCLICCIYLS